MSFTEKLKNLFGKPVSEDDAQWSAADVEPHELVDDEWIKNNTKEVK